MASRFECQHAAILVIRMRSGLHQACGRTEAKQHLLQPSDPRILRKRIYRTDFVSGRVSRSGYEQESDKEDGR